MRNQFRALQLQQTSELLEPWLAKRPTPRPGAGWIQAIRESLGMTSVALARRLQIRSSSVRKFEKAEMDESISLASLRKVATALNCELCYALVPRKPLYEMLQDRARALAEEQLLPVAQTMLLENQALSKRAHQLQVNLVAEALLDGPRRLFW